MILEHYLNDILNPIDQLMHWIGIGRKMIFNRQRILLHIENKIDRIRKIKFDEESIKLNTMNQIAKIDHLIIRAHHYDEVGRTEEGKS